VKFRPLRQAPVLIAVCVIALVCLVRVARFDFLDRLERMTYDARVRTALWFPPPVATNLGFVFISDDSIAALNNGSLGFHYGLYWPRQIYGRLVRELSAQGAEAVAFDVLYRELRPDHAQVPVSNAQWPEITEFLAGLHPGQTPTLYEDRGEKLTLVESDDYFAWQLKRAGMAIVAGDRAMLPHPLFATNAMALADISADRDADGVLRRARAFRVYTNWHAAFKQVEADPHFGVDLSKARVEAGKIVLPRQEGLKPIEVPIDAGNNFDLADFGGENLPAGLPRKAKAFTEERVWHMGIVLAARELKLDLAKAEVDLERGQITFHGADGVQRVLPVDREGYFHINWELTPADQRLTKEAIESLLAQDQMRAAGREAGLTNRWRGKLVVVGSSATGNDLTDRGATPLARDTLLVSKHWNVANSVITGRFVRQASLGTELTLIVILGLVTAWLTWQWRVFSAAGGVLLLAVAYSAVGVFLFVQYRYWLPLVLPVAGALLVYVSLVTYRVVFEQNERRRVKSIFSKIVSPNIVNELLGAEKLSLGGARREVTVFFADVRGFTEFTDVVQEQVAEYVRQRQLTGEAAETFFNESARETLSTVNLYLACVADTIKKHDGTLDKYIGDCVMAFWGAPTPNPRHALACVRAAVEAQRTIHELNQQRAAGNQQRELENRARFSAGLPPKPLLPTLMLGTGINTGPVTVGLMGSDAHILNYTVFGREVNLASRLESVSGRGRIIISKTTYEHLRRDDPALAAACVALPPVMVKGIRTAVNSYEVPWLPASAVPTTPLPAVAAIPAKK
jgi:class 3 adenylate cyclase